MRPEWLKCETCLFFIRGVGIVAPYCQCSPRLQILEEDRFCDSWTCRHCLQPWRAPNWDYSDDRRVWGWEYYRVHDHNTCPEGEGR